jgi:hypothetical protein
MLDFFGHGAPREIFAFCPHGQSCPCLPALCFHAMPLQFAVQASLGGTSI